MNETVTYQKIDDGTFAKVVTTVTTTNIAVADIKTEITNLQDKITQVENQSQVDLQASLDELNGEISNLQDSLNNAKNVGCIV